MSACITRVGAVVALALVLVKPATSASETLGTPISVYMMRGVCSRLVFSGRNATDRCVPRVINASYVNGRTSFIFTVGDLAIVSFSGVRVDQVKITSNKVSQPVDSVTLTLLGMGSATHPVTTKAVGSCVYTNPYEGRATVSCSAQTSEGLMLGTFTSNGLPPEEAEF